MKAELSLETIPRKRYNSKSLVRQLFLGRRLGYPSPGYYRDSGHILHIPQITALGQDLKFPCRGSSCTFVSCQLVCDFWIGDSVFLHLHSLLHKEYMVHGFSFTSTFTLVSSIGPVVLSLKLGRIRRYRFILGVDKHIYNLVSAVNVPPICRICSTRVSTSFVSQEFKF